ncbi:MAG: hypothetical protein M1831_001655 [Alyxoria varia]|nr:MAG: hypothetical protein M1831_001655 [Alyxoria varia]
MALPQTMKQWTVQGLSGLDELKFHSDAPVPSPGDHEVLVKIESVSLNYRDLIIPQGKYAFPISTPVVPCSDGAGTVIASGSSATRFKPGDKVITLFNQAHLGGSLDMRGIMTGLGGAIDGTLREYAVFDENGLSKAPSNLSIVEASTLPCAALTTWNALYGHQGKPLKQGDWVLTQGTGGVSIFGVQFAKAAGASVIATTSSDEKASMLKKLGADHVINYKTTPEWGAAARTLTPDQRGVDHIVEVSGPPSLQQSLNAITIDGVITIIGFVGGLKDSPSFLQVLQKHCVVRGVLVGSRVQLEDMVRAIEGNGEKLRPVVDKKVFEGIDKARDAYDYMWGQNHVGKVCIKIA